MSDNIIETGITYNTDAADASEIDADVYAYADDGEHAVVIPVERVDDRFVRFEHIMCEAGLADRTRPPNRYEIDPDQTTEEWARGAFDEFASAQEAIEEARKHWSKDADERRAETY